MFDISLLSTLDISFMLNFVAVSSSRAYVLNKPSPLFYYCKHFSINFWVIINTYFIYTYHIVKIFSVDFIKVSFRWEYLIFFVLNKHTYANILIVVRQSIFIQFLYFYTKYWNGFFRCSYNRTNKRYVYHFFKM